MKFPYDKGVTNHIGSQSCRHNRKAVREALTGESMGKVLTRENVVTPECRQGQSIGRQHQACRYRMTCIDPTWSEFWLEHVRYYPR